MDEKIQRRRNSKIEDWLTTKMTASDDEKKSEVKVVFLGPTHKSILFDKFCQAANKFEKHVHYDDTYYLTIGNGDRYHTIQFTDPGLARTGAREMAIRCADVAVLVYSAGSSTSLEQLKSLKEDFERRKHIPIRLICDLDEVYEEEDDGSTAISSTSEGYESDRENRIRRHASMEKIRKAAEDLPAATEGGRQLAADLGESCVFLQINGSTYAEADGFLRDLIEVSTKRKKGRSRSLLPRLSKTKSKDRENSVVTITKDASSAHSSVHSSASNENSPSRRNSRRNSQIKESKVCAIM